MAKDKKKYRALDDASDLEVVLKKLASIEKLIKDQNLYQKEVLDFKETCRFLGFSPSYLYKLTCRGEIPHYKPSKKLFFNRIELVDWLQQNRVRSNNELIGIAQRKIENDKKPNSICLDEKQNKIS